MNKISCVSCGKEFHETEEVNYNNIHNCPFCGGKKETNLTLSNDKNEVIIWAKI